MKKTVKNALAALIALSAIAALPAWAAEGRTPIWEPTVISNPGKYIVTQNISSAGGPVIDILVSDVDIDLNGMRLETGALDPIIQGQGENITIRNGALFGGTAGIRLNGVQNVTVEDVKSVSSNGAGIELIDATGYAIRRNQIIKCSTIGIFVASIPGTEASGILQDNHVIECQEGINLDDASSTILKYNRVENAFGSFGIRIANSFGIILDRNTVQDAAAQGIWVEGSFACKLYNNTVLRTRGPGIDVVGTFDSLFLDNVVSQTENDGMVIAGERNHIEGNVLNSNGAGGVQGYGLLLLGPGNVFRRNTARNNFGPAAACPGFPATPDVCDVPAASDSFGDNYMPFLL